MTKFILTPSKGGEALSITYQGLNHVSDQRQLDADDVRYFATVLEPGQALDYPYPVEFTPGEGRETRGRVSFRWSRVSRAVSRCPRFARLSPLNNGPAGRLGTA